MQAILWCNIVSAANAWTTDFSLQANLVNLLFSRVAGPMHRIAQFYAADL